MGDAWPLWPSVGALAVAVVVLGFGGTRLAYVADEITERTKMGKATAGALLLGAVTSLTGIVTTATGALSGEADFAIANPIGGVAIQTVWIAIADLLYRPTNLEHAAASLPNLLQSLILLAGTALICAVLAAGLVVRDRRGIGFEGVAIPVIYLATIGFAIVAA